MKHHTDGLARAFPYLSLIFSGSGNAEHVSNNSVAPLFIFPCSGLYRPRTGSPPKSGRLMGNEYFSTGKMLWMGVYTIQHSSPLWMPTMLHTRRNIATGLAWCYWIAAFSLSLGIVSVLCKPCRVPRVRQFDSDSRPFCHFPSIVPHHHQNHQAQQLWKLGLPNPQDLLEDLWLQ